MFIKVLFSIDPIHEEIERVRDKEIR